MLETRIGFLFKKKYVTYNSEQVEIFELVDYVSTIVFESTKGNQVCNLLSNNNNVNYAYFFPGNVSQEEIEEGDCVFLEDNLVRSIRANGNKVNFAEIRENKLKTEFKYYKRDTCNGRHLEKITNKDLIRAIKKENRSEFDEEMFEKVTDISAMYNSIKKTIVSQDEQIMQILTALFKNQKVVESDLDNDLISKLKENILIYGSTGTGKTEILKRISKIYNIPIVIEDATSLSETGYQGRKITDMLEDLCLAANGDIKLAEKGILVIDEFDKLAEKSGDTQSHVSRLGVQRSLLKLLDGTLFYFNNKQFDTSRLTVVGLGAFTGITNGDDYKKLATEDFMKFGIMRELIGRFSKTIAMNPLEKEDIIKILKTSDFSPLNTYKKLFEMLQVELDFNDDFIEYIADLAVAKKSGARSLKTVFDDCISSALFRIFAGEYTGISLIKPDEENNKPYVLTKTKNKKGVFKKK